VIPGSEDLRSTHTWTQTWRAVDATTLAHHLKMPRFNETEKIASVTDLTGLLALAAIRPAEQAARVNAVNFQICSAATELMLLRADEVRVVSLR
jgi:hypothetical protein